MKCDALVGYGWCRASYVALRSLHRLGLRVAIADEYKVGMAMWSRFASGRFRYADFRNHPDAFLSDINGILERTGAKFYLPAHDEGELVAQHRDRLPADVIIPLHDHKTIAKANNKAETMGTATELGIPVPRAIAYENLDNLRLALNDSPGEYVVKLRRGNSAKGVFYGGTPAEVEAITRGLIEQFKLRPNRNPIVQERVQGEGWGVSCLYWEGQRIATFTHRRLREKTVSGGTSTLRVSAVNPTLEDYAHTILDHYRWHGLAMVEFKWDPAGKRGWFVEINPRLWGSIALSVAAGVDFPALTYIAATRGPDEAKKLAGPCRIGLVARWYLGDIIRGLGQVVRLHPIDGIGCMLPGRADVYDDLPFDDPGAWIGQYAFYLTRFLSSRSMNPTDNVILG